MGSPFSTCSVTSLMGGGGSRAGKRLLAGWNPPPGEGVPFGLSDALSSKVTLYGGGTLTPDSRWSNLNHCGTGPLEWTAPARTARPSLAGGGAPAARWPPPLRGRRAGWPQAPAGLMPPIGGIGPPAKTRPSVSGNTTTCVGGRWRRRPLTPDGAGRPGGGGHAVGRRKGFAGSPAR